MLESAIAASRGSCLAHAALADASAPRRASPSSEAAHFNAPCGSSTASRAAILLNTFFCEPSGNDSINAFAPAGSSRNHFAPTLPSADSCAAPPNSWIHDTAPSKSLFAQRDAIAAINWFRSCPAGIDIDNSAAARGSLCAVRKLTCRIASVCPAPVGRFRAQFAAATPSISAQRPATVDSASVFALPDFISCANAAADCGSFRAQLDITFCRNPFPSCPLFTAHSAAAAGFASAHPRNACRKKSSCPFPSGKFFAYAIAAAGSVFPHCNASDSIAWSRCLDCGCRDNASTIEATSVADCACLANFCKTRIRTAGSCSANACSNCAAKSSTFPTRIRRGPAAGLVTDAISGALSVLMTTRSPSATTRASGNKNCRSIQIPSATFALTNAPITNNFRFFITTTASDAPLHPGVTSLHHRRIIPTQQFTSILALQLHCTFVHNPNPSSISPARINALPFFSKSFFRGSLIWNHTRIETTFNA